MFVELKELFLSLRFPVVTGLFIIIALVDYAKNKERATRFKEYLFVLTLVALSMVLGILHDCITFYISPEYFQVAKGLGSNAKFFPDVILLALNASYSFGLVAGIALVAANNPSTKFPQLSYMQLSKFIVYPLIAAVLTSISLASIRPLIPIDFSSIFGDQVKFPQSFDTVALIHWGTYLGSAIGILIAIRKIRTARSKSKVLLKPSN